MRTVRWLCLLVMVLVSSCAHVKPGPIVPGVDPTLTWDVVTTACDGSTLTGVKYNVYAVSGAGPIPTTDSSNDPPCGVVKLASGSPLNATLIAGPPYQAVVANGVWTFAVEAVGSDGSRSGLSNQVTVTVTGRPAPPINFKVQ